MYTPSSHLFQHSVPTRRPLYVSGLIYASPLEFPVDDDLLQHEPMPALRLIASQRRPSAEAYLVIGNSMDPTISEGEIVLVDPNDAFNTHRPCAFQTPNGVIVKRRGVAGGGRNALLSDNPTVAPMFDLADVKAIGCVYAVYLGPKLVRYVS